MARPTPLTGSHQHPNHPRCATCPEHGTTVQAQSGAAAWAILGLTCVPKQGTACASPVRGCHVARLLVNPMGGARESAGATCPAPTPRTCPPASHVVSGTFMVLTLTFIESLNLRVYLVSGFWIFPIGTCGYFSMIELGNRRTAVRSDLKSDSRISRI